MRSIVLLSCLAFALPAAADEKFDQDRKAILAMAGDFKVGFHFEETLSLREDYKPTEKPYEEEAFETVKVVEDSGKRIVLQHILQAGPAVVKHWAQIWTYEDTELLEFQGSRVWTTRKLDPAEVKGKWTQRVTQVDDSPRYEGIAAWVHQEQSSEWTAQANRPKPRREEKRDDYDLLVVTNRHTITPLGWFHEQDNTKWVKRDGKQFPLVRLSPGEGPRLREGECVLGQDRRPLEGRAAGLGGALSRPRQHQGPDQGRARPADGCGVRSR
jgi:hypothetical protein